MLQHEYVRTVKHTSKHGWVVIVTRFSIDYGYLTVVYKSDDKGHLDDDAYIISTFYYDDWESALKGHSSALNSLS